MNDFAYFKERLPAILRALAVGVPAGYLFQYLHTPIPWMIGPMVGVAALNLMGVKMHSPPYARQMGQVILGSAISLYFTPTVVKELGANFAAIVAATVAVFVVGGLGALTLSRASVWTESLLFSPRSRVARWRWPYWRSATAPRSRRCGCPQPAGLHCRHFNPVRADIWGLPA